ncbi:FCD domain-containing protein [Botrimarina sp.]|uniref:FCD domain-containing protein n=1 Tax=Botrimarina sp. TaxID=2795802 RepID=UPI0032EC2A05
MSKTTTLSDDLRHYYSRYRSLMEQREFSTSMRDRFRVYLFALADPSCPFYEHVKLDSPPSFGRIYDVLSPSGIESKTGWKAEMFRWNGDRGLLQIRGSQLKCRLAIPSDEKAEQIRLHRRQFETETFISVHRLDEPHKRAAIERMREANLAVRGKAVLAEEYADKAEVLRSRLWCDPLVGDWAEKFWARDRDFHLAAAEATGQTLVCDMLKWLLDLSRLRNADRFTIISRFHRSYEEHQRIIEAVEQPVQEGSEQQVALAVEEHLECSETDFQKARGVMH